MSTVYTPKPAQPPATFTNPTNNDPKTAASVATPLKQIADAVIRFNLEQFHFASHATTTNKLTRAAYSRPEQTWFAVGSGSGLDRAERSPDHGRSWENISGAHGLTSSEPTYDIAIADSGKIMIVNAGSRNIYFAPNPSTYGDETFVLRSLVLAAAMTVGAVAYDEAHENWIVVYRNLGNGMKVDTSTDDGVSFTPSTLPVGWPAYAGTTQEPSVTCNPTGKTVACFFDDGAGVNKYRVAHSDDGGQSWGPGTLAGVAPFAGAFNAETIGKPAYDPILDDWYIVGARTTSTKATEIFRSEDDRATWTSVFVNNPGVSTGLAFQDIVCFNGVILAVNIDGRIFASVDRGVTWGLTTHNEITTPARPFLRLQNGQAMVLNSEDKTTLVTFRLGAQAGAKA